MPRNKRIRSTLFIFLTLFYFISSSSFSFAQQQIPPAGKSEFIEKSLRQSRPPLKDFPEKKQPEIIIRDSRKLIDLASGPAFFVKRIEIEGNTIFSDATLAPILDVGEGSELTLGILSLMAQEISVYYAQSGYFLANAYIPHQEVKDGIVKMVVSEGKLGKIRVTGNKKTDSKDFIRRFDKLKMEQVLTEKSLERILLELNELMGVNVRSVLRKGELPGTSDLVLEVTETLPYSISFDGDNFGSRYTGENRFGLTVTAGNLLTLGDQFSVRGVKSDLDQHSVVTSYLYPIPNLDSTFSMSYTYSEQTLGDDLSSLSAGGKNDNVDVKLTRTLRKTKTSQVQLRAGFDYRYSRNYQLSSTSSREHLNGIYLGVGGNFTDRFMGFTFFDLQVHSGLNRKDKSYSLTSRAEGQGDVFKTSTSLIRYQRTGILNSHFIAKFTGQYIDTRALSPDQFSIGGMGTVRGFPISEHSGDYGYTLALEYVVPFPWKLSLGIEKLTLDQVLMFSGFIESGEVFIQDMQTGEKDESITGGGGGIQINFPKVKWFPAASFAASYAVPVEGPDPSDNSFGIWYLNGMLSYTF